MTSPGPDLPGHCDSNMKALLFSATPPATSLHRLRLFLSLFLTLAALLSTAARPAAAGGKVFDEEALRASIQSRGFARVLIRLNAPETKRLASAAFAHKTITPGRKFSQDAVTADKSLADYVNSMTQRVVSNLPPDSYKLNRTYNFFPVVAMDVSEDALEALKSSPGVSAVVEDRPVPLPPTTRTDKDSVASPEKPSSLEKPQVYPTNADNVGAETAWAKGYTGAGWYVAILDSGVLTSHELFAGKNIVEACFSQDGDCPNGQKTMYGPGSARPFSNNYEGYDHGTHVAGIAAGNSGSVFGVAKDANIIAVQIFSAFSAADCHSDGPCVMTWNSDQLKALEYILSVRGTYPIAAVNMSIGGDQYSDQASCDSNPANAVMKYAIDQLRNAGIATVSVSGNDGSCNSLEAPGCISSAIAVGAVYNSDVEADFNNWQYSMLDLLAPGVNIYSAKPDTPTSYEYLSGTSMAAPQVTGAWAILKQKDPSASVSDILYALESTGVPVHNTPCKNISGLSDVNDYKPRINVGAALSPFLLPVPSIQGRFDYAPTDSPVLNVFSLPYPIGVGPIAGSGDIINVRVGLYAFAGPVDIYVAVYAPAVDPANYYILTPNDKLKPVSTEGLVPWKNNVTGPLDESLFGEILDSRLPVATYYVYLIVTPPGSSDTYYMWSTSFVHSGF
jgi:subtilisin family serine protease